MPAVVKSCFKCSGIRKRPGEILSAADLEAMGPYIQSLVAGGLIELTADGTEAQDAVPTPEPEAAPVPGPAEDDSEPVQAPEKAAPRRRAGKKK